MDSVVSFKLAYGDYDEIRCVTFAYGQRAQSKELAYASKICAMYHVPHDVVDLPWYAGFKGALTGSGELPELDSAVLEHFETVKETARVVWVPARNAVFLSIAAAFCDHFNFDSIVVGFNKEEAATFPDNSSHFIARFNDALKYAVLGDVQVHAPLIRFDKSEIALLGLQIDAPLEWSWSCYTAESTPCSVCESCVRRSRAFEAIKKQDPLFDRLKRVAHESSYE
ncbi:MAG: 7-cyano-7-deazaguanine synthase QueC [Euryarchaeota archaeon]|nr:7-cyano-7-deazaguanine synthase QueC [Euryarchaeota archaeon]